MPKKTFDERVQEFVKFMSEKEQSNNAIMDVTLGRWIEMQRKQYKQKQNGIKNYLTDERQQQLLDAGFTFEPRRTKWDDHFDKIREIKKDQRSLKIIDNADTSNTLQQWCNEQIVLFSKSQLTKIEARQIEKLLKVGFIEVNTSQIWTHLIQIFHNIRGSAGNQTLILSTCTVPKLAWDYLTNELQNYEQGKQTELSKKQRLELQMIDIEKLFWLKNVYTSKQSTPWNKKRKFGTTLVDTNNALNLICQTNVKLDNANNSNPAFDINSSTAKLCDSMKYIHIFSEVAVTPAQKLHELIMNPRAQPSSNQYNEIALKLTTKNKNNVIATIDYSDVYRFRLNKGISSNIIDYFFQLLQIYLAKDKNSLFLTSAFALKLYPEIDMHLKEEITTNWNEILQWKLNNNETLNPFEHNTIYVPLPVGSVHWCLAIIETIQKNIFIYDSLVYDGAAKLWYQRLLEYMSKASSRYNEKFDKTQWNLRQQKQNQRQHNGYTSGLFTCWYAHCLITDNYTRTTIPASRYKEVTERKMSKICTNIYQSIVANEIVMP
jgi:hypothetical protein